MSDLSLADELGQAIDAATDAGADTASTTTTGADTGAGAAATTSTDAAAQAATTTQTADTGDARARDASGRFAKGQDAQSNAKAADTASGAQQAAQDPAQQQAATQQQQAQQQQTQADQAPHTWTAAAKAEWSNLSPILKAEFRKREGDYQRGIEQHRQAAQTGQELMQAIGQDASMLAQQYGSVGRGVRELLNLSGYASRDPMGFITWFAQQRGINLGQQATTGDPVAGQLTQQQLAPLVQQLVQPYVQQISQFQTQFLTAQQRAEQQHQQDINSQIEAFQTAAGADGQPSHPYFELVRGTMGALMDSGNATSMDQAYEMACRAHPEVWATLSAQQQKAADTKRLEDARRAAEDAKRANAANVTGQGAVGMADTSKLSLRDELSAHLDGRV